MPKSKTSSAEIEKIIFHKILLSNRIGGSAFDLGKERVHEQFVYKHEVAMFVFLEEGKIHFRSASESKVLTSGLALYIPPETLICSQNMEPRCRGYYIAIPRRSTKRMPPNLVILNPSNLLRTLGNQLIEASAPKTWDRRTRLIAATFKSELASASPVGVLPYPLPRHSGLRGVAENLINSPRDSRNTSAWAKRAGMSTRSFTRHFKAETGLSFTIWKKRVQFNYAIQRLLENISVSQIGFELGYKSSSAFVAQFKKTLGMSPESYRKQLRTLKKS